jgi:hypothetical protein
MPCRKAHLAALIRLQSRRFRRLAWSAFTHASAARKEKLDLGTASGAWAAAVWLEEFLES